MILNLPLQQIIHQLILRLLSKILNKKRTLKFKTMKSKETISNQMKVSLSNKNLMRNRL
jgi:hypothetical protein